MKKILGLFILLLSFISFRIVVSAEAFKVSDYIPNIYFNRVLDGVDHPIRSRFIMDYEGNIVYCIEPYTTLKKEVDNLKSVGDVYSYNELSDAQIRRLELLTYYGYGYKDRTSSDWYVVTQLLIWRTVSPKSQIYFTDTYGGKEVKKFQTEIDTLNNDVLEHDQKPKFVKDYTVNLNGSLDIDELNSNDYEIVSNSYKTDLSKGLHLDNIITGGKIVFRKKSNRFANKIMIYDSNDNQDLIKPGNISNQDYAININVTKGDITLDILKDTSVYTVESDFSNTCYEINDSDGKLVQKVCADDEMIYKTLDLPYGNYVVKQVSHGIGFKPDNKTYNVTIDKKNEHPRVTLENLLIKNTIEIIKYACKNKVCAYESGAEFDIYDILDNKVDTIVTNELGYASIVLGYGTYKIEQINGMDDYTLADSYQEKIVDEETEHKKNLFNYYIEPSPEPEEHKLIPEPASEPEIPEEMEVPPDTNALGIDPTMISLVMFVIAKKIMK